MTKKDKTKSALKSSTKIQKTCNSLRCTGLFSVIVPILLGGILFFLVSGRAVASEVTENYQSSKNSKINEYVFSEKMSDSQKNQIKKVCKKKDKLIPSDECMQLMQKLSTGCNEKISHSCFRHLLNDDLIGYIEGKDSILGLLNSRPEIQLPEKLKSLEKISIFEQQKIPQDCFKSEICTTPFYYKMIIDVDSWANGKPSTIGKLVTKKINLLSTFQSTEGYGKKTKWGMSKKQVKNAYSYIGSKGENILLLSKQLIGKDALIEFFFGEDKLTTVTIFFNKSYSSFNPEEAVKDYEEISLLLTKKYGKYENENMDSKNVVDAMYEGIGGTGRAVRSGRKSLLKKWNTEKTEIEHYLKGEKSNFRHTIIYKSRELIGLSKSSIERKNLDDL